MPKNAFRFDDEFMKDWKKQLPMPIFDERSEYVSFYMNAWELAFDHIKSIEGMPQNPYMDEAFCDTQIWIWDTCFMSHFCKYARDVFPGVESFKNFYEVLYGGKRLPSLIPTEKEPEWTGRVVGEPYEMKIHIADNPPLFAWGEFENAKICGDIDYIKQLLYKDQFLQKHYEWFENLKESSKIETVLCPTCLIAENLGYKWEGGRSGMDNSPRGRIGDHAYEQRPNNPDMLWLDAICQQALSAKIIAELFEIVGDIEQSMQWNERYNQKKNIVNQYYWDENDNFYYDIDCNTREHYKVKTIASYWVMTSGVATPERAETLAKELDNINTFGGIVPFPSLSRDDFDFQTEGGYWRGSVWLPTAYATLKGLANYGYYKQAHSLSRSLFEHMYKTYTQYEPHTIWECYSPSECKPAVIEHNNGKIVRPDFCGWSALGPISIFIECVLGFHTIDAFTNTVKWEKPETDKKIGINNLHFGSVVTDIESVGNNIRVVSNEPYTLFVNNTVYEVKAGVNDFILK